MLKVLLTSAVTGAGKTYACVKLIIKMVQAGETVILAQPTKALNEQTRIAIHSVDPDLIVEMINGDNIDRAVALRLANHLGKPRDKPHAIITTVESFNRLPFIANSSHYHLIIDEVPNAFKSESITIPNHYKLITDLISTEPAGPLYSKVVTRDKGGLRSLAENKKDDAIDNVLQPLAQRLNDDKFEAFVDSKLINDLRLGARDNSTLTIFFLRRPNAYQNFRSVRMIGARAEETILVKWFRQQGVKFVDDEEMLKNLRYRDHTNGPLIDFYYASECNWSLYGQDQDPNFRERFVLAAKNMMNDKHFCWIDNKRHEEDHPYGIIDEATMIPHSAHGRNDYLKYDNIIILTAFNHATPDAKFLESVLGMNAEERKVSFDYHNTYQTLSRISIRDPNNSNRKIVILPDRLNAEWQSKVFPGSCVLSLGIDDRIAKRRGRPKKYANDNERKRANREKLRQEQTDIIHKHELGTQRMEEAGFHIACHENTYNHIANNVTAYQGSLVKGIYKGESYPLSMSITNYGNYLRELHKRIIDNKEDNSLVMPALCIPSKTSPRAKDNALWGRHIYLDFDDTELSPSSLSRIFPHTEIITYNSFSNSSNGLRYRAIFLTDDIVQPQTYTFLWRQIVQCIENAGYGGKDSYYPKGKRKLHGIDNKWNVVDLFYLPCQAKNGKSFFTHYKKGRKPIDVNNWIEHAIPTRFDADSYPANYNMENVINSEPGNQSDYITKAIAHYLHTINTINPQTGKLNGSNNPLFVLDQTLIRGKIDDYESERVLVQAANESRSPKDRLKDVKRYMIRRLKNTMI